MSRKFAFLRGRAHGMGEEMGKNTTNYTVEELNAIAMAFRGTPIQVTHQGMESCKGVAIGAEIDDDGWLVITGAIDKSIPGALDLIEEVRSGGMGLSLGVPIDFKYSSRANQIIANKGLPIEVSVVETPDREGCYISDVDADDPVWTETVDTIWQAEHDTQNARDILKAAGESFASDIAKAFEKVKASIEPSNSAAISPEGNTFHTSTTQTNEGSMSPPVDDSAAAAQAIAAASPAHAGNPEKKRERSDVEQVIARTIGDDGATDASLQSMADKASMERKGAIDAAKKASELAASAAELAAMPAATPSTYGDIQKEMEEDPSLAAEWEELKSRRKKARTDAVKDLPANAASVIELMKAGTESGLYKKEDAEGLQDYFSQLHGCSSELSDENAIIQNNLAKSMMAVASASANAVASTNVRNSELQASMDAHNARLRSTPGSARGGSSVFGMPPGWGGGRVTATAAGGSVPAQSPAPAQTADPAPESAHGSVPRNPKGVSGFGGNRLVRAGSDMSSLF